MPSPDLPAADVVYQIGEVEAPGEDGRWPVTGTLYLDESGGANASMPSIRHCGWGVALVGDAPEPDAPSFIAGWFGAICNRVNTPARAATKAINFIASRTLGAIRVAPDLQYMVNGVAIAPGKRLGNYADL